MATFPDAASRVVDRFEPSVTIEASFDGIACTEGCEITPTQAQWFPDVALVGAKRGKLYTLILSDPDAPSVADPKFGEWQHWIHVNAPSDDIGAGEAHTAYFGSAPGKDSGKHRYCLVAYEQPGPIAPSEEPISATSGFPPRRSFNSRAFAAKYGLKPVGAVTYLAEWDESVPALAAQLQGLPPPQPFPTAASRVVDSFAPKVGIKLVFDGVPVSEGCEVTPTQAAPLPSVALEGADASKLYTLILSDPDAPSVADPKFGEWQHWVVVNAPGGDVSKGTELTAYFGSAPGKDSGKHRYCVVVYEQGAGEIKPDEAPISATSGFPPRRSFNSRAFASKYGLVAVGVVTYVAEWDENVAAFAAKLNGEAAK